MPVVPEEKDGPDRFVRVEHIRRGVVEYKHSNCRAHLWPVGKWWVCGGCGGVFDYVRMGPKGPLFTRRTIKDA